MFAPLNEVHIMEVLSPINRALLSTVQIVPTIASTNSFLLSHCKQYHNGYLLFAEEQTAGRGRHGKSWYSPKTGNIYASLLWHLPTTQCSGALTLAIAVMLVKGLEQFGLPPLLQIKWPNDIYFLERKLGGILVEGVALTTYTHALIIGMGINWQLAVDNPLANKGIGISEIMPMPASRNQLAGRLLDALLTGLRQYAAHGFAAFSEDWQRY